MIIDVRGEGLTASATRRIMRRTSVLSSRDNPPALVMHGCDLLSQDADWDAETWDMSVEGKAALRAALAVVLEEVSGPLDITALWHEGSDPPVVPMKSVTRTELLDTVGIGAVSAQAGYRVAPHTY